MALTDRSPAPWHSFCPSRAVRGRDRRDGLVGLARRRGQGLERCANVTLKLTPDQQVPENRFGKAARSIPGLRHRLNCLSRADARWRAQSAVVLLHRLTDAPYSPRWHVAEYHRDHGFVARSACGCRAWHGAWRVAAADWHWWVMATRSRCARRRGCNRPGAPLDIVGYSNAAALAMVYALDALETRRWVWPDRIVLSSMTGITAFARFSGIAGRPAFLPGFERAARLDLFPEFNPFKYNSFPVNGGRRPRLLTRAVQSRIDRLSSTGKLAGIAPILTFRAVTDLTVSAGAVVDRFYAKLPANGSEPVLYDVNRRPSSPRCSAARPAMRWAGCSAGGPAPETVTIGDARPWRPIAVATVTPPGGTAETVPLGVAYPRAIYSLSHVAPPFPPDDGLAATIPIPLTISASGSARWPWRGELRPLTVGLDWLGRLQANPFHADMLNRIGSLAGLSKTDRERRSSAGSQTETDRRRSVLIAGPAGYLTGTDGRSRMGSCATASGTRAATTPARPAAAVPAPSRPGSTTDHPGRCPRPDRNRRLPPRAALPPLCLGLPARRT